MGIRKLPFIAGHPETIDLDSDERLLTYKKAMAAHGLVVQPEWITYGYHVVEGGKKAARQLLDANVPFTAVIASNDQSAIGAIDALQNSGLNVPDDVAVIGFDDRIEATTSDPPLTTLQNPLFDRGHQALNLLMNTIEGKQTENTQISVTPKLIIRHSCGCNDNQNTTSPPNQNSGHTLSLSIGEYTEQLVNFRKTTKHMGLLTSGLLKALDEPQIFRILRKLLPKIGINQADIAFYQAKDDDPVAYSELHKVPFGNGDTIKFPSREFPPPGLYDDKRPFQLALLPLVIENGRNGFVTFELNNLDLNAFIVQQLVEAFRGVQLYQDAIRDRRLAEEANHLKSRFFSLVSNELRRPLNTIAAVSDTMLDDETNLDDQARLKTYRHQLKQIHTSAQQLDSLILDMLDLTRMEVGELSVTCQPLHIEEVLRPIVIVAEKMAQEKGLRWQYAIPNNLPQIMGEQARLRQVILNLIFNAVKFTNEGEISLTVEQQDSDLILKIKDSGLGIIPEDQEAIFEEFRQAERTVANGYSGLGLGLAMSKRLIEMHKGEIWVESSGIEGEGAIFYFSLPHPGTNT